MRTAWSSDALPILGVEGLVLFPLMVVPFTIRDEKSIRLIEDTLSVDRRFG